MSNLRARITSDASNLVAGALVAALATPSK